MMLALNTDFFSRKAAKALRGMTVIAWLMRSFSCKVTKGMMLALIADIFFLAKPQRR